MRAYRFLAVLAAFAVGISAAPVVMKQYTPGKQKIKDEIDAMVTQGYAPVGIELAVQGTAKTLYVLFDIDPDKEAKAWHIGTYRNSAEAVAAIGAEIKKGNTPCDIAWSATQCFVLYVRFEEPVTEAIVLSAKLGSTFDNLVDDYEGKGYCPIGFTLESEGVAAVLFVKWAEPIIDEYEMPAYKTAAALEKDMAGRVSDGFSPCGFMMAKGQFWVFAIK
ncbi:MAG: hypothetical protein AABZ39_11630 [Spirochaetota bacterium]